jgi:hypothetical protein
MSTKSDNSRTSSSIPIVTCNKLYCTVQTLNVDITSMFHVELDTLHKKFIALVDNKKAHLFQ